MKKLLLLLCFLYCNIALAQNKGIEQYNEVWTSQSQNSGQSMPCGGGDIGLNVWVEKGELLFYIARSGTFDENNAMLKPGRIRIKLSPNPFGGSDFKQELKLQNGSILIHGKNGDLKAEIKLWVDVYRPVIHVNISSNKAVKPKPFLKAGATATGLLKVSKKMRAPGNLPRATM